MVLLPEWIDLVVSVLTMLGTVAAVVVAFYLYCASQRPDVVAYLSHDRDNDCVFVVKNLGKGVAKDVKFESSGFDFVQERYRDFVRDCSFLSKGIPVLAPGANRNTVVLDGPEIKDHDMLVSKVVITYRRRRFWWHKTEKRSFPLDYYSFAGSIYAKSDLCRLMVATEVIAGIRKKGE